MARLLIVDDERDIAVMLKYLFEKAGHSVELAHDGREALAALGLEPEDPSKALPDIVLLDVIMPAMDGYAVCGRMYDEERTRSVPVVMLTGKGGLRELHQRTPNVAAHVDKPFDPVVLRELVDGMLGSPR